MFVGKVLNACRRQRNAHNGNASVNVTVDVRAQRLSASKECSYDPWPHWPAAGNVLNACRRQRNAHHCVRTHSLCPHCAQRLSASKECSSFSVADSLSGFECSTPVGVKGMLIAYRTLPGAYGTVLNACRRQRNAHDQVPKCHLCGLWCSTPVGVKGMLMKRFWTGPGPHCGVLNACRRQRNAHGR